MTVEVACGMRVGTVGVLRVLDGLPGVLVAVPFGLLVLVEEQLIKSTATRTREQAKAIVHKFLLPDAQEFWEVEEKLEILFP